MYFYGPNMLFSSDIVWIGSTFNAIVSVSYNQSSVRDGVIGGGGGRGISSSVSNALLLNGLVISSWSLLWHQLKANRFEDYSWLVSTRKVKQFCCRLKIWRESWWQNHVIGNGFNQTLVSSTCQYNSPELWTVVRLWV